MGIKEKIEHLVNGFFEDESFFIIDVSIVGGEGMKKVSILIDNDKGLKIDDCARLSRRLGSEMEELNLIDTAFHLEISSPGLDRPLKLKRQYQKNVSRKLSVMLADSSIREGVLQAVHEDGIALGTEVPDKANKKKKNIVTVEIPFAEIKKSNVIVSFK